MHTDERPETPARPADPGDGDRPGLWARLQAWLRRGVARVRERLPGGGTDRARADGGRPLPATPTERGPPETATETERTDGRLRVYDPESDGAYVESDTWQEIER
jgi:hypothetical protein